MHSLLVVIFLGAYAAIALENLIKINKSASALIAAGLLWTISSVLSSDVHLVVESLNGSLLETAQIVFFLMGAMTIVEVLDAHNSFVVITSRLKTTSQSILILLVGLVTFFLSSVLDNLTTTIIMISLLKKLLASHEERFFFAGMIVVAANAGGAWTPIGDVTTTMLWIGGQVTTLAIMQGVLVPSLFNLLIPLVLCCYLLRGKKVLAPEQPMLANDLPTTGFEKKLMLSLGLGTLVAVPAFRAVTHLPPFLGVLFGLGILWLVGELLHRNKKESDKEPLTLVHALRSIDMASVIFFVGILLAVAALEHAHILETLARWLDETIGRLDLIVVVIGLVSAVIDNVPLVAAAMGMYDLASYPADSFLWEFMAYCAGTGGSLLIIGSAAGVAAMGLEKISFFWYVRRITPLALLGYLCGISAFLIQYHLLHN